MEQETVEMMTYTDCYSLFLEEPGEETQKAFLECANAIPEKERMTGSVQKQLRHMAGDLLDAYIRSGNERYAEAFQQLDVYFNGSDAENRVINLIKSWVRHPSGRARQAIRLALGKSRYPSWTKKRVIRRFLRLPLKLLTAPVRLGKKLLGGIRFTFRWMGLYPQFGYSGLTLRTWDALKAQDKKDNPRGDPAAMGWAHAHGFLYRRIAQYGLTEENYQNFISDRDYIMINPINSSYKKWIEDIPSIRYNLAEISEFLPKSYYHVLLRDGAPLFVRMPDCPEGYAGGDVNELLRLLREKGQLSFRPAQYAKGAEIYNLSYRDGLYYIGSREVPEEKILSVLTGQKRYYVLQERVVWREDFAQIDGVPVNELRALILNQKVFDPHIVDLRVSRANGDMVSADPKTGRFANGAIPDWEMCREQLMRICGYIPQLEYYAINFKVTDRGVCVMSFSPHPALLKTGVPSAELTEFLLKKVRQRRERKAPMFSVKRVKALCWRVYKKLFCAPGYRDFMLREYVTGVIDDFLHFRNTTLKQKLWCYKRGFYSYRLDQYGLTEDNWDKILSDRDYHWLCPINNTCQKWIEDKMTYRLVITPFKSICPRYYYHIINRDGQPYAIRMTDCPERYPSTFEGILELLEDVGALAVKQSAGEHGDGFFKISYRDGKYYINHDESSREEIIARLRSLKRFYNVTEFLSMHDDLRHIYPGSVNTIRVMVLNPTGCDPYIANAYMRIGTGSTKMTDNIGYGGVFAKVDIDTGRYYGAERLQNHVIVPCPRHPDTDVLIEGTLPDWDNVKKTLTDICNYFGQLEYLGFDVALSSEGVKILEINKYQDLHRCAFYGDTVQAFFRKKIEAKKKAYKLSR